MRRCALSHEINSFAISAAGDSDEQVTPDAQYVPGLKSRGSFNVNNFSVLRNSRQNPSHFSTSRFAARAGGDCEFVQH